MKVIQIRDECTEEPIVDMPVPQCQGRQCGGDDRHSARAHFRGEPIMKEMVEVVQIMYVCTEKANCARCPDAGDEHVELIVEQKWIFEHHRFRSKSWKLCSS